MGWKLMTVDKLAEEFAEKLDDALEEAREAGRTVKAIRASWPAAVLLARAAGFDASLLENRKLWETHKWNFSWDWVVVSYAWELKSGIEVVYGP